MPTHIVKRALIRIRDTVRYCVKLYCRIPFARRSRRVVQSRGLVFTLQHDNYYTRYRWKTYNSKEPETLDWMDKYMKDGDVLFDIGANIGIYSVYACLRHPCSTVIAFEPESANLHYLRDNIIQNKLQNRLRVYSIALGGRTGVATMRVRDLMPGSALHTVANGQNSQRLEERSTVWSQGIYEVTLDDFFSQTSFVPNCLKIDVDGTEVDVLAGGVKTLASSKLRTIMIEFPPGQEDARRCAQYLSRAGFRCVWKDPIDHIRNQIWVRSQPRIEVGDPAMSVQPAGARRAV